MSEVKRLNAASTAGNVDTTWVAPSQKNQTVLYGQVVLTTDATVANRRVVMQVLDADDSVIIDFHSGAVVTASATNQHHEFMQGIYRETSFVGDAIQVPISDNLTLQQGWKVNITIDNGQAGDSYNADVVVREG